MMYRFMQGSMQRLISSSITEINLCIYQLQTSFSELEWITNINFLVLNNLLYLIVGAPA